MTLLRNPADLRTLAGHYANERRVPVASVIKEILHYEILYALTESGAANSLVFQGGTALRLCYQGSRYSEDLDFACGKQFDTQSMQPFVDILQREIASAYGLDVDVRQPVADKLAGDVTVPVARWSAKVHIPNADPSIKQNQVINIEIASVPAHDPDLVAIIANYPHLPEPLRQMMIVAESKTEILADKLVALGARSFVKARDLWDIKFLSDGKVEVDIDLVREKIADYGWEVADFCEQLAIKLSSLDNQDTMQRFQKEMSRFVDVRVAKLLENSLLCVKYMTAAQALGEDVLQALEYDLRPKP